MDPRLQDEGEGVGFNGRRIKQMPDYRFAYDLQKFAEERLEPIRIEGKTGDDLASIGEVSQARAVLGSLNWLGREGRPDLVGEVSILSSRVPNLRIKDLRQINAVVQRARGTSANVTIKIRRIPEERLGFAVVSDASYANVREGGSQRKTASSPLIRQWPRGRSPHVTCSTGSLAGSTGC